MGTLIFEPGKGPKSEENDPPLSENWLQACGSDIVLTGDVASLYGKWRDSITNNWLI